MKNIKKYALLFLLIIISFHVLLLTKLRFTAWPEMLLWPYLINIGHLPYQDIAIAHTPLLLIKLALFFKIFGVGILQLKIFTWVVIVVIDTFLFFVTAKLWNKHTALLAVFFYTLLHVFYDGNGLWFDLMLVPLSIVLFYLVKIKQYLLAGIVFMFMFLTKQTAIWFLVPVVFEFVVIKKYFKTKVTNFILGSSGVAALFILMLFIMKLTPDFIKWAIHFGVFILPGSTGQILLPGLKNIIITLLPFTIFLPLFIFLRRSGSGIVLWAIAGILGAYPRFEYFHLQPAMPYIAIATALVFGLNRKTVLLKIFLLFYTLIATYLFFVYSLRNYNEGTRFYEDDVQRVVNFVKENTKSGDKIFVFNWWDNIYALTNTIPATNPWVPQLSWYQELSGIQEDEVNDLESSRPELIIYQEPSAIGLSAYVPIEVFDFIMSNYKLSHKVGHINILQLK